MGDYIACFAVAVSIATFLFTRNQTDKGIKIAKDALAESKRAADAAEASAKVARDEFEESRRPRLEVTVQDKGARPTRPGLTHHHLSNVEFKLGIEVHVRNIGPSLGIVEFYSIFQQRNGTALQWIQPQHGIPIGAGKEELFDQSSVSTMPNHTTYRDPAPAIVLVALMYRTPSGLVMECRSGWLTDCIFDSQQWKPLWRQGHELRQTSIATAASRLSQPAPRGLFYVRPDCHSQMC